MKKVKIITFGAATQDVYMYGPGLHAHRSPNGHGYVEQFPLGAKVNVEHTYFDTGGGATNAAVTFARQGLEVEFVGKIGRDAAGDEVLRALGTENVDASRAVYDDKHGTGYSVLLLAPTGERTALVYRGASHELKAADVDVARLDADWFYITSLAGNFDLLSKLLKHASLKGIKVAIDPGAAELAEPVRLRELLTMVTVLKSNAGELKQLFGGDTLRHSVAAGAKVCPVVVGTNSVSGFIAAAYGHLYKGGVYDPKAKVVDRNGAGDAFGSGLVSALARGDSVEDALTLASANATAVVATLGAKPGILRAGVALKPMKLEITDL
jgi:sugar/nucleoside kinase (ribokinase family)